MSEIRFTVPGMSCDHCVRAVSSEIAKVAGVEHVDVDLATKAVIVMGEGIDRDTVWVAVDEAGYEAVP
jgi:copper chaperone CopZ